MATQQQVFSSSSEFLLQTMGNWRVRAPKESINSRSLKLPGFHTKEPDTNSLKMFVDHEA